MGDLEDERRVGVDGVGVVRVFDKGIGGVDNMVDG